MPAFRVTTCGTAALLIIFQAADCRGQSSDLGGLLPKKWTYGPPLISPEIRDQEQSRAQKDPSLVCVEGVWHVFMTVKLPGRSAIEHCCFSDWSQANTAKRTILQISDSDYYCAPQWGIDPCRR